MMSYTSTTRASLLFLLDNPADHELSARQLCGVIGAEVKAIQSEKVVESMRDDIAQPTQAQLDDAQTPHAVRVEIPLPIRLLYHRALAGRQHHRQRQHQQQPRRVPRIVHL